MSRQVQLIKHPAQLNELLRPAILRRPGTRIRLAKEFKHNQRDWFENTLNNQYRGIGILKCSWYCLAGITAGTLITLFEFLLFNAYWMHPAVTVLIFGLSGAIVGKIIGIISTKKRLRRTIRKIQLLWRS